MASRLPPRAAVCSVVLFHLAVTEIFPGECRKSRVSWSVSQVLKKLARSRIGFPLVGVTEEVSRAERRLLPQDDPARQPPCFSLISNLALDRHPPTTLLRATKRDSARCSDTEATARSLLQLPWVGKHPPRSSSGGCSTSWSVLRSRVPRRRRSRYDSARCLGRYQRQFARSIA